MKTRIKHVMTITARILIVLLFPYSLSAQNGLTVVTLNSGSSWLVPAGVTSIQVEAWGGGGAGGGTANNGTFGGGGGAAGSYVMSRLSVTPGSNINYSIGAGGVGGLLEGNNTAAQSGSATWFQSAATLNAPGGAGGRIPTSPASGGLATLTGAKGSIQVIGGNGTSSTNSVSGSGGAAYLGGAGGAIVNSTGANGNPGVAPGGGGGGAFVNGGLDRTGGNGGSGRIRITYASDYAYSFYYGDYGGSQNLPVFVKYNGANLGTVPLSASYYNDGSNIKQVAILVNPGSGFSLSSPTTLNITLATTSTTLVAGTDYTFNPATGVIVIKQSSLFSGGSLMNAVFNFTSGSTTYTNTIQFSAAALPVMFGKFIAQPGLNNSVNLSWSTSSEIVNKGFSIERQTNSANGKFESIGYVASKAPGGNSQTPLYYSFTDEMPNASATNFYRLAQQDLDGKISYSDIRSVKLGKETVTMLFPNPSNGVVNISRSNNGKKMNIIVVDQSGRMINQINGITDPNYKISNLRPGIYTIRMTYPETGEQSVQKVVVQK